MAKDYPLTDIMEEDTTPEKEEIFVHDIYGNCQYICHKKDWINNGGVGSVYLATLTAESKVLFHDKAYAVKVVLKTPEQIRNLVLLRSRWKKVLALDHRHLIPYHKVTIQRARGGTCFEFLMDYVQGKDLAHYLAKVKESELSLSQTEVFCYALQISDGLAYLHEKKLIHGDLKPENLLVKHTPNSHKTLQIADLDDIVQKLGPLTTVKDIPCLVGTYRYMSPEMIKRFIGDTTNEKIGSKTDIWSLGCIILEMANCAFGINGEWLHRGQRTQQIKPKEDFNHYEFAELVIDGWLPFVSNSIPSFLSICISQCFIVESVERISAQNLLYELRKAVNSLKRNSEQFPDGCYCVNQLAPSATQLWEHQDADRLIRDLVPTEIFGSTCRYYFNSTNYFASGTSATVYEARITYPGDYFGKSVVAVKAVHFRQEKIDRKTVWWENMRDNWKRILTFKHKHVIRYHQVNVIKALGGSSVEFMMDFCPGHDLARLLQEWNTDGSVPRQLTAVCYGMQIAAGLRFLHDNDLVHGDLTLDNVLVKYTKYRHHHLVIGDLDTHLQIGRNDTDAYRDTDRCFMMRYTSPEMLRLFSDMENDSFCQKADIWNLGFVILDLANHVANKNERWLCNSATGERINSRSLPTHVEMFKIATGRYTPYVGDFVPPIIARCIEECLLVDPVRRLSAEEVVHQLGDAVMVLANSAPESMDCCRECMCCSFFPDSKDSTETFVIFHYLNHAGTSSNVHMRIFNPCTNELHSMPLPPPLTGKIFLQNPVTLGNEVICHAKDAKSSNKAIETQAWDLANNTCNILYSVPALNMSAMVIMENTVYFWNKLALSSPLKSMDLSDGNIRTLPIPAKISEARLTRQLDKIYCCANNGCDTWVQCFDTVTKDWENLPDIPEARTGYSMTDFGSKIYILGGSISDGNDLVPSSTCIRFCMETRTWKPVKNLSQPRSQHGAFVFRSRIHVFGGVVNDSSELSQTMERYDEQSNSWSDVKLTNMDETIADQSFVCTTICGPYKWPKSVKFPGKA